MRLTLSAYVFVEREEGRSVYVCQPARSPQLSARDPLLGTALAKLGNKLRKTISDWIKEGKAHRVSPWLYDPEIKSETLKLTLTLRDRTLHWKLLLVAVPAFDRFIVFSPSIPDVVFEIALLTDLSLRATEVYANWAQASVARGEAEFSGLSNPGEMWIEPLEVDVETQVAKQKKSKNIFAALFGGEKLSGSNELHKVGHCLDDLASDFEPVLGRSEMVDEVDRMLQREDRQGVLVVGPVSVGKTAIIHECVRRRADRFRDKRGHKPQVWWLSPQRLISGMSYLGQWEQRWLAILREATKRDHVLYFDDLVGLFTAGRTRDSNLSAADVLRGYLAENSVRIVAETTEQQLALLRRRDRALADQFHLVYVPEMSSAESLPIVLESMHNVEAKSDRFFHPETIPLVMRHQEIFAPDRVFPGKAIEMTKALAKQATQVVDRAGFYRLAGTQVGANLMLLLGRLGNQAAIESELSQQLIGQPAAIRAMSRIVIRFAQHLQPPDRPLGVLLLLGPTGVGKTESAKALTRLLYNDRSHLVRLDMNELTTAYAAEQLVGTFDQPDGRLTAAVRRQPNCVILLDEIEKAHPDVFDYLLQVIGEGRLTDARGRVADFRSSIIIMTSNLGATEQSSSLGFDVTAERRSQIYAKAAQRFFRAEFFNRIDEAVAFRSLDATDMEKIVRIQIDEVLSRDGIQRRDVYVNVTESAVRRVIKTGFDSQLGARAVRRMLEREVIGPLGDCLAGLSLDKPALVQIADTQSAPRLTCQITQLEIVQTRPPRRIVDLQRLVDVGGGLYERLNSQLGDLASELRRVDEELGGKNHSAAYYALREQVFRCSELLKAAKNRLHRRSEPKLDVSATPFSKPRRDPEGASSKRMMRDWLSQEDLRSAIIGTDAIVPDSASADQLGRQIVDGFATAALMVDYALAPRNWLLGFQPITNVANTSAKTFLSSTSKKTTDHFEFLPTLTGATSLLTRLINCLRFRWQYEVSDEEFSGNFRLVSGVSLLGVLKPLLGTYRTELPGKPRHLSALRLLPIHHAASSQEIADVLLNQPVSNIDGKLKESAEQSIPANHIRGVLNTQAIDLVSGARLEMSTHDWFYSDKTLSRSMDWWMDCLPVPAELLEAEPSPQ